MIKKILIAAICSVLAATMLTGCEKKEEEVSEEYYGQALKEVDGNDIYLIYDGRFVSDDEMSVLSNYYVSIKNKDKDLFRTTIPDEYIKFLEEKNSYDIDQYIESEYEYIASELGEGFDFSQIEVSNCVSGSAEIKIEEIKEMLNGIYSDAGIEKSFSDTVKDAKRVSFDITMLNKDGEEYSMKGQTKYIFNCEDGIYIF